MLIQKNASFWGCFCLIFRQYSLNFDEAVIFVYQQMISVSDYPDWIDKRIQQMPYLAILRASQTCTEKYFSLVL